MSHFEREQLICHLVELSTDQVEPMNKRTGLCHEITRQYPAFISAVEDAIAKWPENSGVEDFPVVSPWHSPASAYLDAIDKWDDTDYGKARKRLCLFVAQELERGIR